MDQLIAIKSLNLKPDFFLHVFGSSEVGMTCTKHTSQNLLPHTQKQKSSSRDRCRNLINSLISPSLCDSIAPKSARCPHYNIKAFLCAEEMRPFVKKNKTCYSSFRVFFNSSYHLATSTQYILLQRKKKPN